MSKSTAPQKPRVWLRDGHPQFEVALKGLPDVQDLAIVFADLDTLVTARNDTVIVLVTLDQGEPESAAIEAADCIADKMRMRRLTCKFL